MDPIEVGQCCISVISGLISLIQAWKGKDEFLMSVREFLNSLGSTIEKYTNSNFANKKHLAFDGLKKQLDSFEAYLIKEKNRNSVVKFFKGNTFIEECEKYIDDIQKWMSNMNLEATNHFGEETDKSFQEVKALLKKMEESRNESKCSFKDDFQNSNAANFWLKYFENQQDVDLTEFSLSFKDFVYKSEKKELPQKVLDKILKDLDCNGNKIVNFKEWDCFYEKIWSRFDGKAQFLALCEQGGFDSPVKKMSSLPPLTLIYKETNKETKGWASKIKPFDFPINHEFVITETGYRYQHIDDSLIEKSLDLVNSSLLVGKDSGSKSNAAFPNIAFQSQISTVSRKQFHITAKNKIDRGYFITDLSLTNPTCLRVRNRPYALSEGMLLDLNTYLFEVKEVFPEVEFDDKSDFYVVSTDHGERTGLGIEETLKRLKINKEENKEEVKVTEKRKKKAPFGAATPYLKLQIMNPSLSRLDSDGEENSRYFSSKNLDEKIATSEKVIREKDVLSLRSIKMDKGALYSIGRHKNNDIVINDNDFDDFFCQFYYDHGRKGWFVVEKHELSHQTEFSSGGTLICLKNFQQYKDEHIGSIGHKLKDGMEIFFNFHVLGVKL